MRTPSYDQGFHSLIFLLVHVVNAVQPRPERDLPKVTGTLGESVPASTMTRRAFVAVCVLIGVVMLVVAGFVHLMDVSGYPAPRVPAVPLIAGLLLLGVAVVTAWRPELPGWFGPAVAMALTALAMAAIWFNGVLPLLFFAPLVMLFHLLLTPAQALFASLWILAWPVVMLPDWLQTAHMPFVMRAWAAAVLVGLMSQFVFRQNRRFASSTRDLVGAMARANRDLLDAQRQADAARVEAEGLAADLSTQLGEVQAQQDRAGVAVRQAELERKRAEDSLMQNLLLEHEQDRLSRLLYSSTEAMPVGLMVLDAHGRLEFANHRVWSLLGVDASVVDPAQGLAGMIRHQLDRGFFDLGAATVLSQAVCEYEQWLAQVSREGPHATEPSHGRFVGVALHDLRLFRGWPMTMTAEGKLEAVGGGEGRPAGEPPAAQGESSRGLSISYHSRTISGCVVHVRSSVLPWGGILRIYTDVSDLVGTAEALGRSLEELRAKDALLQAEVLRSRSEVELNNRFVASVSHEIRTAVQGVTGITAMLQPFADGRPEAALLRDLVTSAGDLHRLSDDLLNLARLRRAGFTFSKGVFDARSLVARCVQLACARLDAQAVRMEWHVQHSMPLLVGDEQRISQVVSNLLQNATKFTLRGCVRVDAWLVDDDCGTDDPGTGDASVRFLHVRVADTGRGIPYGLVGRIFEPFDQGDPSTNRDHGGTGLGLALSLELCEAMGGGISVLSRAKVGSVFEMCVRLSVAGEECAPALSPSTPDGVSDRRAPAQSQPSPAFDPEPPDLTDLRVLVVDDNRLNRKLMSMWIEALGGVVTLAADGAEGVRLALNADFDCVLMDMSMPVMNGLEASNAIRAAMSGEHGRLPTSQAGGFGRAHVPLIGVTAMARREDRLLCLAAGMDAHVAKPVRSRALARALHRVTAAQAWLGAQTTLRIATSRGPLPGATAASNDLLAN